VASHASARKRARQNKKRRAAAAQVKSGMKTALKKARRAVDAAERDSLPLTRQAESALRHAAARGVVPKKRASRQISRLMKALQRGRSPARD
jgi:small subunit ribosomal protein S20